ncbi:unnamed protein product, partial [Laminaria digitata]
MGRMVDALEATNTYTVDSRPCSQLQASPVAQDSNGAAKGAGGGPDAGVATAPEGVGAAAAAADVRPAAMDVDAAHADAEQPGGASKARELHGETMRDLSGVGTERVVGASEAADTAAVDATPGSPLEESPAARDATGAVEGTGGGPDASVAFAPEGVGPAAAAAAAAAVAAAPADVRTSAMDVDAGADAKASGASDAGEQRDAKMAEK